MSSALIFMIFYMRISLVNITLNQMFLVITLCYSKADINLIMYKKVTQGDGFSSRTINSRFDF